MIQKGSLTKKINLILILSLVLGIGLTILYHAYSQNQSLLDTTQNNLQQQSDLLYQSIKNAMLPGQAPIAVTLLNDIRMINPNYEIFLYRPNGVEAFSDNSTIESVNVNIAPQKFRLKSVSYENRMILEGDSTFKESVQSGRQILVREHIANKDFFIIYSPLLNLPKCTSCHGSTHTIRGVIKIQSDFTSTVDQQQFNLVVSAIIFIAVVLLLTFVLTAFLHSHVINPVRHIGDVCSLVTRGDFESRVRVKNLDEIGVLGDTVNTMVEGLYERFQLSKFVSSTTIQSIKNREKGTKAEVTVLFSDVRGFTAYSENIPPEDVVRNLNRVLNIQTEIVHRSGGDVDKYVGDEVLALFTGPEQALHACKSALQIQRELEKAQTGDYSHLRVGIGINTGDIILGMIGSEQRADFTVIGDHVNYGSRLCSAAKPGTILISESTFQKVKDAARVRGPYRIKVKGKADHQSVYSLTGLKIRKAKDSENTRIRRIPGFGEYQDA